MPIAACCSCLADAIVPSPSIASYSRTPRALVMTSVSQKNTDHCRGASGKRGMRAEGRRWHGWGWQEGAVVMWSWGVPWRRHGGGMAVACLERGLMILEHEERPRRDLHRLAHLPLAPAELALHAVHAEEENGDGARPEIEESVEGEAQLRRQAASAQGPYHRAGEEEGLDFGGEEYGEHDSERVQVRRVIRLERPAGGRHAASGGGRELEGGWRSQDGEWIGSHPLVLHQPNGAAQCEGV